MKFYKDNGNNVWAYEDDIPEFGSHTEQETAEDGTVTVEKIYPEFTVKEGVIAITQEEADELIAKVQAEIEANAVKVVPQSLSRFQAIRVLKSFKVGDSNLYKLTDNYIKSLDTDIEENDAIVDAWELAQNFMRDSSTILAAQKQFQLTDDQVDQMFINGSKIEA